MNYVGSSSQNYCISGNQENWLIQLYFTSPNKMQLRQNTKITLKQEHNSTGIKRYLCLYKTQTIYSNMSLVKIKIYL